MTELIYTIRKTCFKSANLLCKILQYLRCTFVVAMTLFFVPARKWNYQ